MSEQNQDQQQNNSKIEKQYNGTVLKLQAILKNKDIRLPKNTNTQELENLVAELYEEEHEAIRKDVKDKLRGALKTHAEMLKQIAQKEKELKDLTLNKQKEFIKTCSDLFSRIDGLDGLVKSYTDSLKSGVIDTTEEEEEND